MKKRRDSFWGLHSDFHARPEYGTLGETLREEDIREICRLLRPDYWQIDSKGHYGWASYPSQLGNSMPTACDTLGIWRSATRAEDVAMFVHYSGVIDNKYCREHPDQSVSLDHGNKNAYLSVKLNGRYADDLLIPQISEMVDRYGIDGAWIDGDCWGVVIDTHPDTLAAFKAETGIDLQGRIPETPDDDHYLTFREYQRELFRRYLNHYLNTLHEKYPGLQITSNWMYSDHAMEPVTAPVDFLSGDLNPWNCVNWARYAGRAMAQQNMPWDLMAWGMRSATPGKLDYLHKHPTQLMQEAAAVISLGGGFQVDILQHTDSVPHMEDLRKLVPVAEFMKAREPFCKHGRPLHQAALLMSIHDRKLEEGPLYGRGNVTPKLGLTALLCDIGQSLEILSEHNLEGHYQDYAMLVVPEIEKALAPETISDLLEYAARGGSLLLMGTKTCKIFAEAGAPFTALPVKDEDVLTVRKICTANAPDDQRYFTLDGKEFGAVFHPLEIQAHTMASVIASTCYDTRGLRHPYAVVMDYGKGKIAAIGGDMGTHYCQETQYMHRNLMKALCDTLYMPMARVESACGLVELVCFEKDGRFLLQLVNANGSHSNVNCATDDMIPPALDIHLSVACPQEPEKILLQPEGKSLDFTWRQDRVHFIVDRLNIHNIIEFVMT